MNIWTLGYIDGLIGARLSASTAEMRLLSIPKAEQHSIPVSSAHIADWRSLRLAESHSRNGGSVDIARPIQAVHTKETWTCIVSRLNVASFEWLPAAPVHETYSKMRFDSNFIVAKNETIIICKIVKRLEWKWLLCFWRRYGLQIIYISKNFIRWNDFTPKIASRCLQARLVASLGYTYR